MDGSLHLQLVIHRSYTQQGHCTSWEHTVIKAEETYFVGVYTVLWAFIVDKKYGPFHR